MRLNQVIFCLVFLWGLVTIVEGAVSSRQAGFVSLREGIGARAAAMGEAYTAVVGDQTAAFWNPAGVAPMQGKDFLLVHNRSIQGIQQAYGGWAYGNGKRGIGLSLAVFSVGGLETRTGPSAEPLGTFSLYDLNAGFSYAQRFGERLYMGSNLRALHENIGPESAWGFAVDVGAIYRLEKVTFGAAYRNVGRTERLDRERIRLPRTFRVGAAYRRGAAMGSVDFRVPEQGAQGIHLGLEYAVKEVLFLRGGYRSGHETRDFSFGFGLVKRNWRMSYAFVPSDLGWGGSHRMAVGIR
ncbi:MAG: PorV/PorQ family protein [bacterium]|nr:PorV/PorQ family protein [bacterium]